MRSHFAFFLTWVVLLDFLSLCISFHLHNHKRVHVALAQHSSLPFIARSRPIGVSLNLHMSVGNGGLLRTALKVSNLDKSVSFYTSCLGMKVISNDGNKKCARLGYKDDTDTGIDLVEDPNGFQLGDAFLGFGISRVEAASVFSSASTSGGKIVTDISDFAYAASQIPDEDEMKTTPVRYGRINDPDGYIIEVHEGNSDGFMKSRLKVLDLEESIVYYEKMGCKLLRKRSNVMGVPKEASLCAFVGGESENEPYIELVYPYATTKLDMGNGLIELAIKGDTSTSGGEKTNTDPNGYSIQFS